MTETNEKVEPKPIDLGEYKYGFHDDVTPVFSTGKGISEDVVRAMSAEKGEPEWMLEFRLKSLETFNKMAMQEWGPDLSEIDFDDLTYFQKASDRPARDWEDVPEKIKEDNSLFPHLLEGIQPKLRLPWAESADEDMERILMGEESLPLK